MALDVTAAGSLSGLTGTWPAKGFDSEAMTEAEADALVEWMEKNPADTCALDIAERGEHTLIRIAGWWGFSRERVRQIEEAGLRKAHEESPVSLEGALHDALARRTGHHLGWADEHNEPGLEVGDLGSLRKGIVAWETKQGSKTVA